MGQREVGWGWGEERRGGGGGNPVAYEERFNSSVPSVGLFGAGGGAGNEKLAPSGKGFTVRPFTERERLCTWRNSRRFPALESTWKPSRSHCEVIRENLCLPYVGTIKDD